MFKPEQELQIAIVAWWDRQIRNHKAILHHSPNGGFRRITEARKFKAMGVRAGFPDLLILQDGQAYFVELKAGKGKTSEKQEEMLDRLGDHGFNTAIVRSLDEFIETVKEWRII